MVKEGANGFQSAIGLTLEIMIDDTRGGSQTPRCSRLLALGLRKHFWRTRLPCVGVNIAHILQTVCCKIAGTKTRATISQVFINVKNHYLDDSDGHQFSVPVDNTLSAIAPSASRE